VYVLPAVSEARDTTAEFLFVKSSIGSPFARNGAATSLPSMVQTLVTPSDDATLPDTDKKPASALYLANVNAVIPTVGWEPGTISTVATAVSARGPLVTVSENS